MEGLTPVEFDDEGNEIEKHNRSSTLMGHEEEPLETSDLYGSEEDDSDN
jgi:hypothetical protein